MWEADSAGSAMRGIGILGSTHSRSSPGTGFSIARSGGASIHLVSFTRRQSFTAVAIIAILDPITTLGALVGTTGSQPITDEACATELE